jgi:hypothetical protein
MIAPPDSILNPQAHKRLIADLDHVCQTANVPATFVHRSMKGLVSDAEIDWVKNFNTHRNNGVAGICLVGTPNSETRIMAICGALIRNFIDARIMPLNTLLALQEKDVLPEPTVLLVPNLFLRSSGKSMGIPPWKIQVIYDVLLQRFTSGKPTVLYVEEMDGMASAYGQVFADHINSHYKLVQA